MRPLSAAIVRLGGQHASAFHPLRQECLLANPEFWGADCIKDLERPYEKTLEGLTKHATSETVAYFGLMADGVLGGNTFTYLVPKKRAWFFGGTYVQPAFRGPLEALSGERAVDCFYEERRQFVAAREPNALLITGIRRPNLPSIKAAQRHGFKCVTAVKNRPTMAGTSNNLLYFHRKLGG